MTLDRTDDPLIGETLGHYRVVEVLGRGGMGVVYAAEDTVLRRGVALKVLGGALVADPDMQRRLLREARSAAAVTHPNIASIYEVGEHEGRVFIAMERVVGRSLREVLQEFPGGMPWTEVERLAREIARGLAKAHDSGIVHRDLKPDNVMLGDDDEVKLLDFGLAKAREGAEPKGGEVDSLRTADGQILGTPAYMSPEQARGRAVDERSDVFSFGVVLYELATGIRPFGGETTMETLIAVSRDEPALPSALRADIPLPLEGLIARCLMKDPALRFANARAVLDELRPNKAASGPTSSKARAALASSALEAAAAPTQLALAPAEGGAPAPSPAEAPAAPGPSRVAKGLAALGGALTLILAAAFAGEAFRPEGDRLSASAPASAVSSASSRPAEPRSPGERRLTYRPAELFVQGLSPSPDGQTVSFVDSEGAWLLPVGGRDAVALALPAGLQAQSTDWLDANTLLVAAREGEGELRLLSVPRGGGETRTLRQGPFRSARLGPDRTTVLLGRSDGLFVGRLAEGELRSVVTLASGDSLYAWDSSPDGRAIAFIRARNAPGGLETSLEVATLDGETLRRVLVEPRLNLVGGIGGLAWAGPRTLLYALGHAGPDAQGAGLWELSLDDTFAARGEGVLRRDWDQEVISGLRFSAVDRRLYLIKTMIQHDVFRAELEGPKGTLGPFQRFTLDDRNDRPTGYLPDGRVLFMSDRKGTWDAFAQRPGERTAELLAGGPGLETWPVADPRGGVLFFRLDAARPGERCPLFRWTPGAEPREVLQARCEKDVLRVGRPPPWFALVRCGTAREAPCVLSEYGDDTTVFTAFDPETGARRGLPLTRRGKRPTDWAPTADGRLLAVLFPEQGVTLLSLSGQPEKNLSPKIPGDMQYVTWAPGERSLLVTSMSDATPQYAFHRVTLTGEAERLWTSDHQWIAEPQVAPDGKSLVVDLSPFDTDAWVLDGL